MECTSSSVAGLKHTGQPQAQLTCSLKLHPPETHDAYVNSELQNDLARDTVLCRCALLPTLVLGYSQCLMHFGLLQTTLGFMAPIACYIAWAAALSRPEQYIKRRVAFIAAVRVALIVVTAMMLSGPTDALEEAQIEGKPHYTLLLRVLLMQCFMTTMLEALGLQLPFTWQIIALFARTGAILASKAVRDMIGSLALQEQYAHAADALGAAWQSVLPAAGLLAIPHHASLAGRNSGMFLFITLAHVSTLGVICFMWYLLTWADLRAWIAQRAEDEKGLNLAGGVRISQQQLQTLRDTPAAAVLFDKKYGVPASCGLYALLLWVLCHAVLLLSQLLVYQLVPQFGGQAVLDAYYPVVAQ